MADGNTPTYNLILPEIDGADGTWGISLNSNLGSLDSLLSGGTALSAITVTGTVTAGGVSLASNEKAVFGAEAGSNYLEIFESSAGDGYIGQHGSGNLVIQGQNGYLLNDAGDTLVAWLSTYATLAYRGPVGAGVKLTTNASGIDVTGEITADLITLHPTGGAGEGGQVQFQRELDSTVDWYIDAYGDGTTTDLRFINAGTGTDITPLKVQTTGINVTGGVAADYIDLTGGKSTTTTGTIAADKIIFSAHTNDTATIFAEVGGINNDITSLVLDMKDDGHELIEHRIDGTTRLTVKNAGIDVTGTVTCDEALTISSTGAATDAKPDIWLFNNAPAAVNERLGQITWFGKNDASPEQETVNYAFQEVKTTNVGDGTEQAEMQFHIRNGANHLEVLTLDSSGIDVTGDLDVTGTITSNAFAYSKATVNNAADILYTAFNSFAGKRIINTASATATTYGLPTPVAADIGKSWIICNPTDSTITIDHDASGTANYVWIMDGVTLSAAASSWSIKKGAVVEIVVAAAAVGGGSATAPNYLIFGAGLLEL